MGVISSRLFHRLVGVADRLIVVCASIEFEGLAVFGRANSQPIPMRTTRLTAPTIASALTLMRRSTLIGEIGEKQMLHAIILET
jgi:hypothetical protein